MMQENDSIHEKQSQTVELRKESTKQKHTNRHVSVLYGTSYLTKVPVVKRCRKTQQDCFANIKKTQIFQLVHGFVNKLLQEDGYLEKVIEETKFDQNQLETKIIQTDKSIDSTDSTEILTGNVEDTNNIKINVISADFEKINNVEINVRTAEHVEEKNDENYQERDNLMKREKFILDNQNSDSNSNSIEITTKKNNTIKKPAKSTKKISIMLQCENLDLSLSTSKVSSALFSQQSLSSNISSMEILQQQLTMKMIQAIYQQPQPFLINLSVCLMLKYLHCSKTRLNKKNVCWILSVGTIVAYKLYYDEPVEGLVESFAKILKLTKADIVTLERNFLKAIDHQAVISSQQYHSTLYQIIKDGKQ